MTLKYAVVWEMYLGLMQDPLTSWQLRFIQFTFPATFLLPLRSTDLNAVMNIWEAFVEGLNAAAPAGVNAAYQTLATSWAFTHTQEALIKDAMV